MGGNIIKKIKHKVKKQNPPPIYIPPPPPIHIDPIPPIHIPPPPPIHIVSATTKLPPKLPPPPIQKVVDQSKALVETKVVDPIEKISESFIDEIKTPFESDKPKEKKVVKKEKKAPNDDIMPLYILGGTILVGALLLIV